MSFTRIETAKRYQDGDIAFTPIAAHHGKEGYCHNYIIERGGKTMLYASDTGGYDSSMYAQLASHQYDCVVVEGTFGLGTHGYSGHMNLTRVRELKDFLKKTNCLKSETLFVMTHTSPHWAPPHDVFEPMLKQEDIILAYDGLSLEF